MDIVAKFGGSSLSDSKNWKKIADILKENKQRRLVVLSAQGKRFFNDIKVTDLLIEYCSKTDLKQKNNIWQQIKARYATIAKDFSVDFSAVLNETEQSLPLLSRCAVISRGEYLSAKLFALINNFTYLEAAKLIKFDKDKKLLTDLTFQLLRDAVSDGKKYVIGGFYGSDTQNRIVLFDRGGSDISGALFAAAVNAEMYENWTDVSGFYVCDPRIVLNPVKINCMSFEQLKTLSRYGAGVLHADSVYPASTRGIPIIIKSIFKPHDSGTSIVRQNSTQSAVIGITALSALKIKRYRNSKYSTIPDNPLFFCRTDNFDLIYLKQGNKIDGKEPSQTTAILTVVHNNVKNIADIVCKTLDENDVSNHLLCYDDRMLMTEISPLFSARAIKKVYNRFFE